MNHPLSDFELGLKVSTLTYEEAARVLAHRRDLLMKFRQIKGIDAAVRVREKWAAIKTEMAGVQ